MILKVLEGSFGWALKVDSRELTWLPGVLPSWLPHPLSPRRPHPATTARPAWEDIPPLSIFGSPWASLWLSWLRILLQYGRPGFDPWVRKIPWRRNRLPTPVFLDFPCGSAGKESACNAGDLGWILGWEDPLEMAIHPSILARECHGLYSPWGRKQLDTTEWLTLPLYYMFIKDKNACSLLLSMVDGHMAIWWRRARG